VKRRGQKEPTEAPPADAPAKGKVSRIGFLNGKIKVPDDFDTMFAEEIEEMFYGEKVTSPRRR
jgi:hypothetical protein